MKIIKDVFILIVSDADSLGVGTIPAKHVLRYRLTNRIWGFNKRTRNRIYVKKGSKFIFYISGNKEQSKCFLAEAEAADNLETFLESDLAKYENSDSWYTTTPTYKVSLKNVKWFKNPVSIFEVKDRMDFFEGHKQRKNWGILFQGGCLKISSHDYSLISEIANS